MSTQALEPTFSNIIAPDDATKKKLALISRAQQLAEACQKIAVNSQDSYIAASETLKAVKGLRAELETICRPEIDAKHKAHKEALKQFSDGDAPLAQGESTLKRSLLAWDQEQERIRRQEQERLQREAQAAADAEALRVAEEQKIREAIAAEEAGDKEAAAAILEKPVEVTTPVFVPPIVLPVATPRVEGISKRQNWKFTITDAALIPREYLTVDEKKIGAVVRAMKDQTKIPGVQAYPEDILSSGSR